MTRPLTAQIKPSTKGALMDQLALAADTIIELRAIVEGDIALDRLLGEPVNEAALAMLAKPAPWDGPYIRLPRRWWHRLMWWRK